MTKLWILSDLHRDHGALASTETPPADADIAVIAGDVVDDRFLVDLSKKLPVVFVAGNHEFYGHALGERSELLEGLPIHFLDDRSVMIDGIRFIGSTLWTDYNGGDPAAMYAARHGMNDHRRIKWQKDPWMRFRPEEAAALHGNAMNFLLDELPGDDLRPTVVVTHHAPSAKSVHQRFAGQVLNYAYYSNLDNLVAHSGAALWVHGHVHNNFDYQIGETRVLCNPCGYPGENKEFNPALIVDI